MKYFTCYIRAVLAGVCIGLGGTVYLRVKDAFPSGGVVGALLFAVGLFAICTRGYDLYTGKACAIPDNRPVYLIELAVIWFGNFCGTSALALMLRHTALCGENGIDTVARSLVAGKMEQGYVSLFILGIICNIFIYIAVNGYQHNPHISGKYIGIFLGVSAFILCGTEHSVADMFYWGLSGVTGAMPGESLKCLLAITAGNTVGAVIFPVLEKMTRFDSLEDSSVKRGRGIK